MSGSAGGRARLEEVETGEVEPGEVDFDLHGFVRVRLHGATARDVRTVARQLGPLQSPVTGEPDISITFVDEIDTGGPVTYAGWLDAGFTSERFVLLRGQSNVAGRVAVWLADVGRRCHLVCERRLPAIPQLLAIVNFTALAKGVLPLHASAFLLDGCGVLATGWAKGGKTETLLAFMARGARYVGDEWVYLTPGGEMFGVPEPIRLWDWQLRQLPGFRRRLTARERSRLTGLALTAGAARRAAQRATGDSLVASVTRRLSPVVARQVYVQMPPERLFGAEALALRGHLDVVLLVASHASPAVELQPIPGAEVAARMLASLAEERAPFMAYYRQFRYAFPDAASDVVEDAPRLERDLLLSVLGSRPAALLRHPYPVAIGELVPPVLELIAESRG